MAFVDEFLGSIGVEQQQIDQIMAMLDESAQGLASGKPGEVGSGSFGGSAKGVALSGDTSLAHQHVVDAINEMVAGLKGYRINVRKWHDDYVSTDEDNGARINRVMLPAIDRTAACTQPSDFHDTPATTSCDVPSVSTTGGEG
jgi:hypothetical protein